MGEAIVTSLKKLSRSEKENATAAISALAPAMKPKPKPTVEKPKNFRFAPGVHDLPNDAKMEKEAKVAASKLMRIMRRWGGGSDSP